MTLFRGMLALLLLIAPSFAMAETLDLDGRYQCRDGVATGLTSLDRVWTPTGAPAQSLDLLIADNASRAVIEKIEFDCRIVIFEILACTTGFYHFSVNVSTGRYTYDKSYGYIRGEDPRGDAEPVTTSLGICRSLTES